MLNAVYSTKQFLMEANVARVGVPAVLNDRSFAIDNAPNSWKQAESTFYGSLDRRVRIVDEANR